MKKPAPKKSLDTKVPRPGTKEGMNPSTARRVTPIIKTNLVKPKKK